MNARDWFDRLATALLGDVPFNDMLPVKDQLIIKHHGTLGDCLKEQCGSCDAVARDLAALEAGHHVAMSGAEASIDRRFRPYDPLANLPAGIDPRSPAALEHVEAEIRRARGST